MEDVDDEDIELLRLTALKSLNVKKEQQLAQVFHPYKENNIHILENNAGASQIPKYLHSDFSIQSNICLPQQFVKHTVNTVQQSYTSNNEKIQLSPRSAAFVSKNYDILMKRKEDNFRRSPSFKWSPSRWSVSPPPIKQNRYSPELIRQKDRVFDKKLYGNNRDGIYDSDRRTSRSPPIKTKNFSRSPPKSPVKCRGISPNFSRSQSRSPVTTTKLTPIFRNSPPRYLKRSSIYYRRSPIDHHKRPSSNFSNKSPFLSGIHTIHTSNTNRDRRRPRTEIGFKSASEKINKSKSDKYNRPHIDYRKKRKTPDRVKILKSHSTSESIQKSNDHLLGINIDSKHLDGSQKDGILNGKINNQERDKYSIDKNEKINSISRNDSLAQELQLKDHDNSNESVDEEDDGIDLFASDESESENEGRFKCSPIKNEKPKSVSTVSFSKLGNSPTTTYTNLNDISSKNNLKNKDILSKSDRSYKLLKKRNDRRYDKDINNRCSRIQISPTSGSERKKKVKSMFKSTFHQVSNNLDEEKPIGK